MQRKTPIRSCVACRTSGEKLGLLRIVKTPSGEIVVDTTGKMAGRGAYICPSTECLKRAIKEKRLSRALRAEIPEDVFQKLDQIVKQGTQNM